MKALGKCCSPYPHFLRSIILVSGAEYDTKKKMIIFTMLGLVLILILSFICRMMYGLGLFDRKLTYDDEKAQFAKRKVTTT